MNTKGLGKVQRLIVEKLNNGWYIWHHIDFSRNESQSSLTNGNDYHTISRKVINSLIFRNIITAFEVYHTVQPDTETIHYKLR